ncbi:collagen alpha-1(I) chain-like [Perognathus longimembris pacificus]|uniref:collagen alpha-1(I) chain-like n=1 Tax=Perognathus longimembris pacificus TaxID=214514 RepID=UPI002019B19D|nr:collagen alpha-1(I) chain-like [Perognathus longimembris pacificus]
MPHPAAAHVLEPQGGPGDPGGHQEAGASCRESRARRTRWEQETTPSEHTPAAETTPSEHTPAAETTPSEHTPAAETTPSEHTPAAETTPSEHTPAAETTPSEHTPAAETTPSEHTPAAETTPSEHTPAAETTPSEHTPAAPPMQCSGSRGEGSAGGSPPSQLEDAEPAQGWLAKATRHLEENLASSQAFPHRDTRNGLRAGSQTQPASGNRGPKGEAQTDGHPFSVPGALMRLGIEEQLKECREAKRGATVDTWDEREPAPSRLRLCLYRRTDGSPGIDAIHAERRQEPQSACYAAAPTGAQGRRAARAPGARVGHRGAGRDCLSSRAGDAPRGPATERGRGGLCGPEVHVRAASSAASPASRSPPAHGADTGHGTLCSRVAGAGPWKCAAHDTSGAHERGAGMRDRGPLAVKGGVDTWRPPLSQPQGGECARPSPARPASALGPPPHPAGAPVPAPRKPLSAIVPPAPGGRAAREAGTQGVPGGSQVPTGRTPPAPRTSARTHAPLDLCCRTCALRSHPPRGGRIQGARKPQPPGRPGDEPSPGAPPGQRAGAAGSGQRAGAAGSGSGQRAAAWAAGVPGAGVAPERPPRGAGRGCSCSGRAATFARAFDHPDPTSPLIRYPPRGSGFLKAEASRAVASAFARHRPGDHRRPGRPPAIAFHDRRAPQRPPNRRGKRNWGKNVVLPRAFQAELWPRSRHARSTCCRALSGRVLPPRRPAAAGSAGSPPAGSAGPRGGTATLRSGAPV